MSPATRRPTPLPEDISALLARNGDVITLDDAKLANVLSRRITRWCRLGLLTRVGPGVYASTTELDAADSWHQIALRGQGLVLAHHPAAFLVGHAAAALLNLRTVGRAPRLPEVVAPPYTGLNGRTTAFGRIRRARLPQAHMRRVRGRIQVMSAAWVVVDLARHLPIAPALALIDGVARDHLMEPLLDDPRQLRLTGTDLADALATTANWPGHRRAAGIVAAADPGSERAIESIGRAAFLAAGLPPSVSNAWIQLRNGRWRRVDHLWPWHGVVGEADGAVKYDDLPNPSAIIADEKEREWQLRALDLVVGRYTWDLAQRRHATLIDRFNLLLGANPPRSRPVRYFLGQSVDTLVEATPDDWPAPDPVRSSLPPGPLW